jgi:hypothetical protein
MFFIAILFLSTLSIAGTAAFFSVYGLAQLFQGMVTPVLIMGASLEAGKLVAASFLYRYWAKLGWVLRSYLVVAVLMLMVITSVGIFGMLSIGYQADTINLKQSETKVELLKQEQQRLSDRKAEIDKQIQLLPTNTIKGRQQLMKSFGPELKTINSRIPELTSQIQQLSTQLISTQAHTGPIVYIAKAFGKDIDDATKYIILLLIVVFDPLAVALTIGVNVALRIRKEEQQEALLNAPPVIPEKPVELNTESSLTAEEIKMLISEEIKQSTHSNLPAVDTDEHIQQLHRKNQLISDIRSTS